MKQKIVPAIPVILAVFFIFFLSWYFSREIKSLKINLKRHVSKQIARYFNPCERTMLIPKAIRQIPTGEQKGLILDVKTVPIRNVPAPYNASLIEDEDGKYLLFFRYDILNDPHVNFNHSPFTSHIGWVRLDENLEQTEEGFQTIDTKSCYSEDPRAIKMEGKLYLVYNDILPHTCYCRTLRVAEVDLKKSATHSIAILDPHIQAVEKNWAPFVYQKRGESPELYFQYHFNPHKILRLLNFKTGELDHLSFPNNPCLKKIPWQPSWGELRGGTPARLVDGEYLAFFHTMFKDSDGTAWYLMGAYTFSSKPPFELKSISRYPILFQGIYETLPIESAPVLAHVIFPAGFCPAKKGNRDVFYVSCGENDSAVKILTIDKKALFNSLRRF